MKIFKIVLLTSLVIALACATGSAIFFFEPLWKSNKVKAPSPYVVSENLGQVTGTDIGVHKVCLNGFWYILIGNQNRWKLLPLPTPDQKLVECIK